MVGWFSAQRSPIGVDLGSRVIKLAQLNRERSEIVEAAHWELPADLASSGEDVGQRMIEALVQAREGKRFQGRDAVVSLGARQLVVQNVRVPKAEGFAFEQSIRTELGNRFPFPLAEAELRWIDAADVRQGDAVRREVIVIACHRPVLDRTLEWIERSGLWPVAVDVEPLALLRVYHRQFRRELDQNTRTMLVHVGYVATCIVIAQGADVLFIKYIELGGKHFDEAVAKHLRMSPVEASTLRRHNGDRRADQQDPDVARSVAEACRSVVEKLIHEVSLCIRYHGVTFRGQPLRRLVIAGGEATPALVEALAGRIDMKCELGDPLRTFQAPATSGRPAQWDLSVGLALRGGA